MSCFLEEMRKCCDTGLLALESHLLRTIGMYEDAFAGPKYTKTRVRWFLHHGKNHILYSFPLRGLRFINAAIYPLPCSSGQLEKVAGFPTHRSLIKKRRYQ